MDQERQNFLLESWDDQGFFSAYAVSGKQKHKCGATFGKALQWHAYLLLS